MPPTVNCQPSTVNSPAALPYHSTASIWLSVDPLSDKYPGASPYVYCAGNPVRLVDVDGRSWETPEDAEYAQKLIAHAQSEQKKYDVGSDAYNRLQEGIDGLTFMGEFQKITFSFKSENVDHSSSFKGNISIDGMKFHINHLSSDKNPNLKDGSAWHEAIHLTRYLKQTPDYTAWKIGWHSGEVLPVSEKHGYRIGNTLQINKNKQCEEEIYTYHSQFLFDPKSMVPNILGNPIGLDEIPSYVETHYNCNK